MQLRRYVISICLGSLSIALPVTVAGTTPAEASRFLTQATFGANWEEIQRTADMGLDAWLDEQFQQPVGYHQPPLDLLTQQGLEVTVDDRREVWWQQVLEGPDPLRQRVALALSEILVVSDSNSAVRDTPVGLANYYDMLLSHSFGNYRDLLHDVALHPLMGVYLSHLRNYRTSPGRFPDENFAREIMQLFSIGLFEMRPDGALLLDGAGQPIPTYDIDDITELAKVFTGLSFDGPDNDFSQGLPVWTEPMRMYSEWHEPGPKNLLRGVQIPAGQTGMQDVRDAVDSLVDNPNTGPFIGRRLIQRLVTSNPSPEFIGRISAVFANNGSGVRGDLAAVVRAILTDPEARSWPTNGEIHRGMLRESFLRRVHLARAFDAHNFTFDYPISDRGALDLFAQRPLSSPSVFNFFLPDYQPTGPIAEAALVGPEFQIITAVTAIGSANALRFQVDRAMNSSGDPASEVVLDLSDEIALAANPTALVDRLDLLLLYGDMSPAMRSILISALTQESELVVRTQMAIHLISISPEYCVVK